MSTLQAFMHRAVADAEPAGRIRQGESAVEVRGHILSRLVEVAV